MHRGEGDENGDADDVVRTYVSCHRAISDVAAGGAAVAPVTTTDTTPIIGVQESDSASSHFTRQSADQQTNQPMIQSAHRKHPPYDQPSSQPVTHQASQHASQSASRHTNTPATTT